MVDLLHGTEIKWRRESEGIQGRVSLNFIEVMEIYGIYIDNAKLSMTWHLS